MGKAKDFCDAYLSRDTESYKSEFNIYCRKETKDPYMSLLEDPRWAGDMVLTLDEDDLKYLFDKYSVIAREEVNNEIKELENKLKKLRGE